MGGTRLKIDNVMDEKILSICGVIMGTTNTGILQSVRTGTYMCEQSPIPIAYKDKTTLCDIPTQLKKSFIFATPGRYPVFAF